MWLSLYREERRRERRERGGREREGRGREGGGQGSRSERARAWEEETPDHQRPLKDSGDTPYNRRTGEMMWITYSGNLGITVQWNLVNTNAVKGKYLLKYEIPWLYNTCTTSY